MFFEVIKPGFLNHKKNENDNKMTIYALFQFNLLTKTASRISN